MKLILLRILFRQREYELEEEYDYEYPPPGSTRVSRVWRSRLGFANFCCASMRRKICFREGAHATRNTGAYRRGGGITVLSLAAGQGCVVALRVGQRMIGAAKIYFIIFGILTIVGGIVGYVKAGSMASIVAGSISGLLLLLAAWLMPEHQAAGLAVALLVSLLLAAQFIPKFFRTFKVMPAGLMSVLSALGIIVAIAAWLRK
jgi:uncharacterized membrane protein (UPF0136 family)